jgi:hypothetical protein
MPLRTLALARYARVMSAAAPEQRNVVCPRHGLGYDAAKDIGCVRCRREAQASAAPARAIPRVAIVAGAGVFVALVVGGALVVALRGAPRGTNAKSETPPAVAGEGALDAQLTSYLRATWSQEKELPIAEARHAFSQMPDEIRMRRLDVDDRRRRIKAFSEKLAAQKTAFAALPVPEPASRHRMLFLNWYTVMGSFVDIANDQLHLYEDALRLNEKGYHLSWGERHAHDEEVRSTQQRIEHTVERARALEREAHDLGTQKRAEEERLIRDYKLGIARDKPSGQEDDSF